MLPFVRVTASTSCRPDSGLSTWKKPWLPDCEGLLLHHITFTCLLSQLCGPAGLQDEVSSAEPWHRCWPILFLSALLCSALYLEYVLYVKAHDLLTIVAPSTMSLASLLLKLPGCSRSLGKACAICWVTSSAVNAVSVFRSWKQRLLLPMFAQV